MTEPPDLGPDPRPLPNSLRATGMDAWDGKHGGLLPRELAVLVGDLALGRGLALTWLVGLLRASGPTSQAYWYRTAPTSTWSPAAHEAAVRGALGELRDQVELGNHSGTLVGPKEHLEDVTRRIREWAAGAGTQPPVAVVIIDALPMLARTRDRGARLRGLARLLDCPVVVLDTRRRPRGGDSSVSVLAGEADYVLELASQTITTTPRYGMSRTIPWSPQRLP